MECMFVLLSLPPEAQLPSLSLHSRAAVLTLIRGIAVGHLPVHAVRHAPPEVGHPCVQGEVAEHGQLEQRAGRCKLAVRLRIVPGPS